MSESERLAVAMDNILNLRVELLVAAQLQQTGALAEIYDAVAASAGQPSTSGNVAIPELGLIARWTTGTEIGMAGTRVHYDAALMFTKEQWTHHWNMAALQVKNTIENKGQNTYSVPSIVVVDVSRLGETSRLFNDEGITGFQAVLDGCNLGNLYGALLVRSVLTAENLWPVCSRLDASAASATSVALATAAVLLGKDTESLVAIG